MTRFNFAIESALFLGRCSTVEIKRRKGEKTGSTKEPCAQVSGQWELTILLGRFEDFLAILETLEYNVRRFDARSKVLKMFCCHGGESVDVLLDVGKSFELGLKRINKLLLAVDH